MEAAGRIIVRRSALLGVLSSTSTQPRPTDAFTRRPDIHRMPEIRRSLRDQPVAQSAPVDRVLFVLQTTTIGGMESHCVDLAAEFSRRSITVRAVVPKSQEFAPLADRFLGVGIAVNRIDTDARTGRLAQVAQLVRLGFILREFRPDVVHLQTGGATGGAAVAGIARLAGAVSVVTEHDVPVERPTRQARILRVLLDRCAHVLIAVSRRNAALRISRMRPTSSSFAVVLNGVPIPEFDERVRAENREAVRQQHKIGRDQVVVGSVVRLADGKGLPDLVRAFAAVQVTSAGCDLMLVGDGPLRMKLEELAQSLGIADRVHFAGNQRQPGRFMDALDVFVLAVPEGSMSIALLEAMARGLPSLITFCGPEEAIRPDETGVCGPPNDPAGLAAALTPLVRDSHLRRRLGVAAAAHVRRHYSVSRVADDVLDLYLSQRRGAIPERLRADSPLDPRPGDRHRVGNPSSGGM